MAEPMHLSLNDGKTVSLNAGVTKQVELAFDSTVFMDADTVVYTVEDPSIAYVSEDGELMGLTNGITTLTATMLPSGRTASIPVTVRGAASDETEDTYPVAVSDSENGSATADVTSAKEGETVTIKVTAKPGYRVSTVSVTDQNGSPVRVERNADGTYSFTMPQGGVTVEVSYTPTSSGSILPAPTAPTTEPTQPDMSEPSEQPEQTQPEDQTPDTPETCPGDETCPLSGFSDLSPSAWYHDGVHFALENGVMNGMGDGLFQPETATSRAMIVTMLWRMEGEPGSDYNLTFQDVVPGSWYAEAVRWAAAEGIVEGYSDEAFGPADNITREQLAAILYRYARYKGLDVTVTDETILNRFEDAAEVSPWALTAMQWAVQTGLISGMTETTLSPKTSATRAQVATMLMRFDALISE